MHRVGHRRNAAPNFQKPFWLCNEDPLKPRLNFANGIYPALAAKADRLKQAKQEAEKEIKAYKAQREEQFQKRMSDVRPAPYLDF